MLLPLNFADNMFPFEPFQSTIKHDIIHIIIIALGQHELLWLRRLRYRTRLPLLLRSHIMGLKNAMNDGSFSTRKLVDCDVASLIPCVAWIGKEENVSTIESRFHRPAEDIYVELASF